MSTTGDALLRAEQEAAFRELSVWAAGNTLKDALRQGDEQAMQIVEQLIEEKSHEVGR
jgi:hypothetical protein